MTSAPSLFVVLTGPSAVGKDSLLGCVQKLLPGAHFAITATSRQPRPGEQDSIDYYFYTPEQFEGMIERGELLEHARVYGDWKGVPKAPIRGALRAGKDVLMRTDVQGARYLKARHPDAITIFVNPPSREELGRRLRERAADDEEQTAVRLTIAEQEMAAAGEFDFVVINDDLERTAHEVVDLLERERHKPGRKGVTVD